MTREINFSELCGFSDKQWLATRTSDAHAYTLFGGSRGPGKSYWLRWALVRLLLRWAGQGLHGVNVMLGCEDYPSLIDRQIGKIEKEFPSWLGVLRQTKDKGLGFHLHARYGGGSILLRNLDDPSKYQSAEFAAIAIDELTKNPRSTFDILRGSLRWPGIPDVRFLGATNPAPGWVRDFWIAREFPDELCGHEHEFVFVPALPSDNPHLAPAYWEMLATLTEALRQAWLDGNWYAAVEGLVYATFADANLTDNDPIPSKPYDLAIDDGYVDPRATLFVQRQPNGDLLIFDELYETQMLEEQTIEHIQEKQALHNLNLPRSAVVSHEAVALRRRLRQASIPAVNWMAQKVTGGQSTRLAAITLTRSMICDGKGYRAIRIHRRCKRLLDEISAGYKYPEGKHGLETHPADGNDHACLVSGTLVTTADGYKPIEEIRVGDYVLTRQGYKRVLAAGCTAIDAPIWQVDFSDGRTLQGTANHPVWVDGKGYSTVDALHGNDIIMTEQNIISQERMQCESTSERSPKRLSSMALNIIATQTQRIGQTAIITAPIAGISRRVSNRCTEKSGKRTMAQFQTDTMCITKTGIRSIMTRSIWNACHPKSMESSMMARPNQRSGGTDSASTWTKFAPLRWNGMEAKRDCNGTPITESIHGRIARRPQRHVSIAAMTTKRLLRQGQSIVRPNAGTITAMPCALTSRSAFAPIAARNLRLGKTAPLAIAPVRVLQSKDAETRQAVFNLTVEDANEYFANGILVHNCNTLEGYIWAAYGGTKAPKKKPTSKEY